MYQAAGCTQTTKYYVAHDNQGYLPIIVIVILHVQAIVG